MIQVLHRTLAFTVAVHLLFWEADAFTAPSCNAAFPTSTKPTTSSSVVNNHHELPARPEATLTSSSPVPRRASVLDESETLAESETSSSSLITTTTTTSNSATRGSPSKISNFFNLDSLQEKIGRVDDDRILFPEYEAGEVSRLYSSLQYTKTTDHNNADGNSAAVVTTATHRTGSVLGAASLVAGTMVGAGILALPSATAPVGFLPSTAAMAVGWVYMTMSGLLIAELCLNRLGMSGKPGQGMLELYEDALGPRWSKIGSVAYFFLHYTLLVAYLAQGGANLNAMVGGAFHMDLAAGLPQVAFASVCAAGLYGATPSMLEKANNAFVLILSVAFLGIIGLGASTADFGSLVALSNQHPEKVADAFPIIFLSLVYHNIVPTVVNQLEGDRGKITTAIIGGTTVPTLMFLAWNAVVLGNMDPSTLSGGGDLTVDPVALLQAASAESGNAMLSNLVSTFSSLALVTSLIGFVYGLLDGWTDVFGLPTEGPAYEQWKAPLFGLVFLPPLALSLTYPEIFYKALEYGGAFGVSTLFLVLPPVMVWKQRYGDEQAPLMTKPMVPLGKLPLGSMWKAAATLIVEQGADKLGVFDFIKELLS